MSETYKYMEEGQSGLMVCESSPWGGQWTEEKLEAFEKYVNAYLTKTNGSSSILMDLLVVVLETKLRKKPIPTCCKNCSEIFVWMSKNWKHIREQQKEF